MFSLSAQQQYFLYRDPTDMRKSFNGLSGLVRNELDKNPMSGAVFIFINRRRNRMKLLVWQSGGFVLYYKQLEQGTFELPLAAKGQLSCTISWQDLVLILEGVSLKSIQKRKRFSLPKTG
ncbi:MAG TPA: transposase [Saprospiraceae bacterium]|nr:transposase [Saprospiraceae bacterium]